MHCTCLLLNMGAHASFVQMSILHFTAIHVNQDSKGRCQSAQLLCTAPDCLTAPYLAHHEPASIETFTVLRSSIRFTHSSTHNHMYWIFFVPPYENMFRPPHCSMALLRCIGIFIPCKSSTAGTRVIADLGLLMKHPLMLTRRYSSKSSLGMTITRT